MSQQKDIFCDSLVVSKNAQVRDLQVSDLQTGSIRSTEPICGGFQHITAVPDDTLTNVVTWSTYLLSPVGGVTMETDGIVVPVTGYYRVSYKVEYGNLDTVSADGYVSLTRNGSALGGGETQSLLSYSVPSAGTINQFRPALIIDIIVILQAGDKLSASLYQNSAGAGNCTGRLYLNIL